MANKKPVKKAQKASAKKPVQKAAAKKPVAAKPAKKSPARPAAKPAVKKAAAKAPATKKPAVKTKTAAAPVKAVKAAPKKPAKAPVASKAAPVKKAAAPKPIVKTNGKPVAKQPVAKPAATVKKAASPKIEKPVAQPLPKVNPVKTESVKSKAPSPAKAATPAPAPKQAPESTTQVKKPMSNVQSNEKTRYSDAELKEFKELIMRKIEDARAELVNLQAQIINANENGTDDTGATFKMLEDGSDTLAKEEAAQLAARQKKFIEQLEAALVRIENKTYGICRVTGKLIPKERLRAVPHTTQSMEAKLQQYRD